MMDASIAADLLTHLRGQQESMVQRLTQYASLETPSADPVCQQPMFDLIAEDLRAIGFHCEHFPGHTSGGQMLAESKQYQQGMPLQLLLGHCDTVWPHGTLAEMPIHQEDGCLYGPGVYDMKAGLLQAIFALTALRELKLQPEVSPIMFINSDEEIGSAESVRLIKHWARAVDRAFVLEPALEPGGRLKTSRKGVGRFTITITGKASHAGLAPEKGISAIVEASHLIQTLFAMNDPQRGVSVNVGNIVGGTRPNVVAAKCELVIDVRVVNQADAKAIEQAIGELQPTLPGAQLEVSGDIGRPPMEATPGNRKIWQRAEEAAGWLDLPIEEGAAGGGSDGNFTSLYTPTLDGMGAVGDGAHALNEHVVISKMPERAALLACLLMGAPIQTSAS